MVRRRTVAPEIAGSTPVLRPSGRVHLGVVLGCRPRRRQFESARPDRHIGRTLFINSVWSMFHAGIAQSGQSTDLESPRRWSQGRLAGSNPAAGVYSPVLRRIGDGVPKSHVDLMPQLRH